LVLLVWLLLLLLLLLQSLGVVELECIDAKEARVVVAVIVASNSVHKTRATR